MFRCDAACAEDLALSRRGFLTGATSLALWGLLPRPGLAQARAPRLLTVILRGGLDGLALAAPIGDPDYARLRANLAMPAGGPGAGLPLDGFFALNANMPFLHGLYQKRKALIVHAVATPYRERSHFDGQDVLESGLPGIGRSPDGWLNRALVALPSLGAAAPMKGLAVGAVVPLIMRGPAPVLSWSPKTFSIGLRHSTVARLIDLYTHTDPRLARAFAEGMEIDRIAAAAPTPQSQQSSAAPAQAQGRGQAEFVTTAEAAARFLATADGPRIGALSYNGWDTHANEGAVTGQLANRLAGLDAAVKALHDGLGAAWAETVIVILTEFGRTVRVNGTEGTDHGTATVALLVGGPVKGGRILADWPGLADKALYQGRDLAPTRDLRGVLKGVLRDHLGLSDGTLAASVFPDSAAVAALDGLIG